MILSPLTFSSGLLYASSPYYKMYVLFGGVLLNALLALHIIISAFIFLNRIYATKGIGLKEFLQDWIFHQDGFRYIILIALNSFYIYSVLYNLVMPQNEVSIQMFCKKLILTCLV
jgi:hypothetical protein